MVESYQRSVLVTRNTSIKICEKDFTCDDIVGCVNGISYHKFPNNFSSFCQVLKIKYDAAFYQTKKTESGNKKNGKRDKSLSETFSS